MLVKPNFVIAMIPVVGIYVLVRLIRDRTPFRRGALIIAAAALLPILVLMAQYASIYGGGIEREETLTLAPFAVWNSFSSNIPLVISHCLLLGVATGLVVLVIRRAVTTAVTIGWLVLAVTIGQAILFAEQLPSGSIATSGNWFWGAYTALLVLVLWTLAALRDLLYDSTTSRSRVLPIFALALLALHVAAGVYYALVVGTAAYGTF